jgi:hypothetical protein
MRPILALLIALSLAALEVGPASTAVVINGGSAASGEIARGWMRLRGIPEEQAVVLSGLPAGHLVSLADFRSRILAPVEAELTRRGLAGRIALIAYAPDLPTAVSFPVDAGAPGGAQSPGSITGMTLLAPLLDGPSKAYTALYANPYAGKPTRPGLTLDIAASTDPRNDRAMQALKDKDLAGAQAILTALAIDVPAPGVLYNLACVHALLGALPEAEYALSRAIDAGWMDALHTAGDTDLTELRTRPAWTGLLQRTAANLLQIRADDSLRFSPLPAGKDGIPGRLAMVLGNLGPRGLTVAEVQAQLAASVAADGSEPRGTVWFMVSGDQARTGPRRWAFAAAAKALTELGVAAEVRDGVLPPSGAQVAGATIGIAGFDWPASGAAIVPGAWCDHLTSTGGALQAGAGQTPFTVFLRAGAAGSGGAVSEPLNHHEKFPSAFVHLHRVRGLTLVEAVHRSMSCPYQYLAMGDPLSRPWKGR